MATQPLVERVFRGFARVVRAMGVHRAFEASAAVAFWFFLSLIPLLALAGFLVGQVARTKGINALVGSLLEVVPSAAEGIVREEVDRLARASASSVAPVGVAGFLWTASSGLHNLMNVFETAAQGKRRPWWKQRGIALGWIVLGLAVTCLLASLLVEIDTLLRHHASRAVVRVAASPRHGARQGLHGPLGQVITATLMLLVGTVLLGGLYRFAVDHPGRGRPRIWPGAVTAVACWLLVSWGFGAYVVSVSSYALYYGSLAAVAVMLVWLYLTSLSLAVGAEVNADLESVRSGSARSRRPRERASR